VIERSNLAGLNPTGAGAYILLNVLTSLLENSGPSPDIWIPGSKKVGSKGEMIMSENKNVVEIHGCIVCAKLFNLLVVYTPQGKLLDCTVTSPGGQIVPDERQPLVACDTHTAEEIESAYKRWQSTNDKESEED
jgi:hypothetical protein